MTSLAVPAFTSPVEVRTVAPMRRFLFEAASPATDDTRRLSLTFPAGVDVRAVAHLETVVARVNDLLALPDGWNGGQAHRPTPKAALLAVEWLCRIVPADVPAPSVVPVENGGVQLEWIVLGSAFEIEAGPEGSVSVLGTDSAGNTVVDAELPDLEWESTTNDARKFLVSMFTTPSLTP